MRKWDAREEVKWWEGAADEHALAEAHAEQPIPTLSEKLSRGRRSSAGYMPSATV